MVAAGTPNLTRSLRALAKQSPEQQGAGSGPWIASQALAMTGAGQ